MARIGDDDVTFRFTEDVWWDADAEDRRVRKYDGTVLLRTGEDDEKKIGEFVVTCFDLPTDFDDDEEFEEDSSPSDCSHLFSLMDGDSQEAYELWEALRKHRASLQAEKFVQRIVYLDKIVIVPEYRKRGIGREWLHTMFHFFPYDTLICSLPSARADKVEDEKPEETERRQLRLQRWHERAGFQEIGDSGYYYADNHRYHPNPKGSPRCGEEAEEATAE